MLEVLNSSIAVTAGAHNPSILHPSFLVAQQIVPVDWALAEAPVCTAALSIVKYANGIVLTVDTQKFQVIDNSRTDPRQSAVPTIVDRYTRTLPHVRYTGVGTNVSAFVETTEADAILMRFLASGSWNQSPLLLQSVGIRLVYRALDSRLHIAIDGGSVQPVTEGAPRVGILIGANYHVDVDVRYGVEQVAAGAARFADYYDHFVNTITTILQLQTEHATR